MTRFNAKAGSALLIGLAALYLGLSLASGRSARAEPVPDSSAGEAGLDVWRALALLSESEAGAVIVDVRPAASYELYHLPGSRLLSQAGSDTIRRETAGKSRVLIVAESDSSGAALAGALGQDGAGTRYHFLRGGASEWYLNLELPAPLFSSKAPPYGYSGAIATVRAWLATPTRTPITSVREAIARLASLNFVPDQLAGKKKLAPSGARKKISGGCG